MAVVWGALVVALVLAIAAVVIGREARRLDAVPPSPVFELGAAVDWVADHLPFAVSAELSHADVQRIIEWNLEYFRTRGVSGNGNSAHVEGPVFVGGAEAVEYVLGRAGTAGEDYTSEQVHAVLEAQMSYLDAIGAIGPQAPDTP
jgi:hypothetical protein